MMNSVKRSAISTKSRWSNLMKSRNGLPSNYVSDVGLANFSSKSVDKGVIDSAKRGVWKLGRAREGYADSNGASGISNIIRGQWARERTATINSPFQVTRNYRTNINNPCFIRPFSSTSSKGQGENQAENRKDISTTQDPFDAPTYNIPEKPVTFTEGASYSLIIIAGLGVAALAAYAVFKELIFEPKEYKIFGKALDRVKNDSQVRVRIGSPITGYGQESRNRAARQRIPNKMWTDESGVEHVQINFHVRGPHGAGVAFAEMYKDKADKQWKYISLIVQIKSPSPTQLILESYIPT